MKNIEKTMESIGGTVFLYCSFKDEKSISFFSNAAEHTGRRLLRWEDCQALNTTNTVSRRDRWWLLDMETSGLNHREDDIIALRLACMEDYNVMWEWEIPVRPRRPLQPWTEQLTGISNQDLDQAVPLDESLLELEKLDGPLLFLDRDFGLPFLGNAFSLIDKDFYLSFLLLDRLAALLLGGSPKRKTKRFLEQLPPPAGWTGSMPRDRCLSRCAKSWPATGPIRIVLLRGTGSCFIHPLPGRTGRNGRGDGRLYPRSALKCGTRPAGGFGKSSKLS